MDNIYIVLIVSLVAWFGIFSYLARLDMRLKKLERRHEK